MEIIIAVVAVVVLFGIKIWYDEVHYKKRLRFRLEREWGMPSNQEYSQEKMQGIAAFFYASQEEGDIDDITWNDLELEAVYQQMNHTRSAMGQEYLYSLLRKPELTGEKLEERERLISFFEENKEKSMELQMELSRLGKMGKFSVYSYLNNVNSMKKESSFPHILQMMALIGSVALCLVWPSYFIMIAIGIAIYNMVTYYQRKAEMERYYQLLAYILRTVHFAKDVSKLDIPELEGYLNTLSEKAKLFDGFCRESGLVVGGANMSGDLLDTLMDYIRLLTHIDIIKFQSMAREAIRLEKDLMVLYETIGFMDSMVALASYRTMMQEFCIPQLHNQQKNKNSLKLTVEKMYHPLLEEPVKNSIDAKGCVLLTGSNASGKSTFIKTVAINAILAQTIHTVLADSYEANYFRIYSSMALRDDIMSSESYYIVEIKSLKRILDQAQKAGAPVLCFIDEVLRGTNTVERIASSSQILMMLAKSHTMCFAATHDIELTNMLEAAYDNYHFEEKVEGNDVIFDYQLRTGKALTRNAIKLLGMIGYQQDIIQKAEDSVQHFLETGDWKL